MNASLYRLTPLRPPVAVLEPGTYLYASGADRLEVDLREPMPTRKLAALVRRLPVAREVV